MDFGQAAPKLNPQAGCPAVLGKAWVALDRIFGYGGHIAGWQETYETGRALETSLRGIFGAICNPPPVER